ncbi:T9SS C-terminal target domain-containing protein [Mucilaginibacter conchicola]|uniref:T9SS C-terminal target domain-containing protein n=1 Tax=Mucilaginibacter conchicola TaxID=2303333 RepID=A0A372NNX6_9SPHI|nr:S8 family serine peptidase [Mucilaginibacter conchicola]RFZ90317.1 T9SS C-terminal target domain-containing protein [Mucilaginibacter conchicola]
MLIVKKYPALVLFVCLYTCITAQVFGQVLPLTGAGKQELDALSVKAKQNFTAGFTKAAAVAKQNGWALRRLNKAGNLVALQGLNERGFPVFLSTHNNTIAAATTGTNTVQPGGSLNLDLSGSSTFLNGKLGIWDGGSVYAAHREFAGKTITLNNSSAGVVDHSTHVAGTMLAKGVYAPAKGMAFNATTLASWDFDDDVSEMSAAAPNLLLSNHSYGDVAGWDYNAGQQRWEWYGLPGDTEDYLFGFYDSRTRDWDKIAYNAPYYLMVESAGNSHGSTGPAVGAEYWGFRSRTDPTFVSKGARPNNISSNNGYDVISTTGTAKNILTVGSVGQLPNGPVNRQDVVISGFSSWGPTDDGRIKPDVVGCGELLLSTGTHNTSYYYYSSGTSMAAPNVTGSLYLLQEYYAKKNNGAFMRAATLKGLACHTAFDAGNVGPDYVYGWGLLNMKVAAQAITDNNVKSLISENTLAQGQTKTVEVTASGIGPLVVSISWTDPEGTPTADATINNRTPKLVNDLDLRISDGETTYRPWVLTPDNPSAAATTGDNIRDNIEQVYIANAIPGKKYTVTISHKGTLRSGSQAYSLIATGVGGNPYCASAPTSTADSKINNFTLSNINKNGAAGCTSYTDNTNLSAQLEIGKTYPFSITMGTCGANFNKAAKIFIDWNGNGVFDAGELVATTNVINGTGTYAGNITVPTTVTAGNTTVLRIVLTETSNAATITACGSYAKGETQDYRVQFVKPSVDAGATAIVNSAEGVTCASAVAVKVRLKNFGSAAISNIPVTVTITGPGNTVTTFTETFSGALAPEEETDFVFGNKFNTTPGSTYTVTATTKLDGDPITANNTTTGTIEVGTAPVVGNNLQAYYCVNTKAYELSGSGDGQLFWYTTANGTVPVGTGSPATVTTAPINNTYYAGLNDFSGHVGYANKAAGPAGGYNQFSPGVRVTTQAPVILESARLYIGSSGKITFSATNDNGEVVSSVTLNVTQTRTTTTTPNLPDVELADDPLDQGKVFALNLLLPAPGNYTITPSYESGASIYRNKGTGINYPFTIGSTFKIAGNEATSGTNEGDTTYYRGMYYYFYDMQVRSPGCASAQRAAVTVTKPVITQSGDDLQSSITGDSQWFLNGEAIAGAIGPKYTPLKSGVYTVEVTLGTGCIAESDGFSFQLQAKDPDRSEIALAVFPVPANTYVNIVFNAPQAADMRLSLVNAIGQTVYQNSRKIAAGNFSTDINTSGMVPGTYIIRIDLGQKQYSRKVIIAH